MNAFVQEVISWVCIPENVSSYADEQACKDHPNTTATQCDHADLCIIYVGT